MLLNLYLNLVPSFFLIFLYCTTFIYSDQIFSVGERHSEVDTLTYNKLGYEIAALIHGRATCLSCISKFREIRWSCYFPNKGLPFEVEQ